MTWSDALAAFEAHLVDAERSPLTLAAYREDLESFEAWYFRAYETRPELGELGAAELRAWKTWLTETCKQAPASVNRRLAALRSLSKWAVSIGVSPAPVPRSIREVTRPPKWLTTKEQHALIRATEKTRDPRTICVVKLLLHTGVRVAELAKATAGSITIGERSGEITVVGKGRKQRVIPLNVEARNAIRVYRPGFDEMKPGERLLDGQRGPLGIKGIQRIIGIVGDAAKLADFGPHVLRHTCAHELGAKGVPIQTIARLMGHSSLDTTQIYVAPGQAELAAAMELLSGGED